MEQLSWMKENGTLEQFLKENEEPRKLIDQCRGVALFSQQDTSMGSQYPYFSHMFYFDAFQAHPIFLDRVHGIYIYPEFLARAFLQKDVYSIAKVLCSAIFNEYNLKRRNAQLYQVTSDLSLNAAAALRALPTAKRNCIIRVTKWIFDKEQCPWKISASNMKTLQGFSQEKNKKELQDIRFAFLTFEHISKYCNEGLHAETTERQYIQWLNQSTPEIPLDHDFWLETFDALINGMNRNDVDTTTASNTDLNNPPYVASSPDSIDPHRALQTFLFQRRTDNITLEEVFRKIIEEINEAYQCQSPFSNVDLVRVLTKLTFLNCDDVFSDAAQFSIGRWTKAKNVLKYRGPVHAAEVLFRRFWVLDFKCKTFDNIDKDFSPVKFLAIIRAIAKMQYDETEDNHDRFLDSETISEIKAALNAHGRRLSSMDALYFESENSSSGMENSMAQSQSILEEDITDPSLHPGMKTWKNLVSSGQCRALLLSVDDIVNVSVDQPVPQLPAPPPQPQVTPSESGTINYYFDSDKNLILPTMNNMAVSPDIWKYVNGLGARGTLPLNVVRGKELFKRLLTPEEKLMQFSPRNNMPIYPPHKLNAILDIIAILKEINEKRLDIESLVNCRGPLVNKLTDLETSIINTKVFKEYGYLQRNPRPTKRKMDDDG